MVPKSVDPDKYVYSDYGIRFDLSLEFSLPDGSVCKMSLFFELIRAHPCILIIRSKIS